MVGVASTQEEGPGQAKLLCRWNIPVWGAERCLMSPEHRVLRGTDEAKELHRHQTLYSCVKRARDFGIFPKSSRKPVKYFQEEGDI